MNTYLWASKFHDPNIIIIICLKVNLKRKKNNNPLVFWQVFQEKENVCATCIPLSPYEMSQQPHDVVIIILSLNLIPQDQILASNSSLSNNVKSHWAQIR